MRVVQVTLIVILGVVCPPGSTISADSIGDYFYVTGHVNHPGRYVLDAGMTVGDGIFRAGDFAAPTRDHTLTVVREVDGKPTKIRVALSDPIAANDTIDVRNTSSPRQLSGWQDR